MPRLARVRPRKDGNHTELVNLWRNLGGSVLQVHGVPHALDLVVGYGGVDQRVEIKDGSLPPSQRKLTDGEQKVFDTWRGRPPVVWLCEDDVMATFHELRMEQMARGAALRKQDRLTADYTDDVARGPVVDEDMS